MKKQQGHAGDVQFKQIASLPKSAKQIANTPIAYGEKSGHVHVVTGDVELFELDGKMFAAVGKDGAVLQHLHESVFKNRYEAKEPLQKADHNPIKLGEGTYEFGIHKKYNPFSKVFERVLD
jgi:hypothetical protein